MTNFVTENRLGHVRVTNDLIETAPETAMVVLGQGLVLRAEFFMRNREVEYTMACPAFDPVQVGELIPSYEAVVEKVDGETPDDPALILFKEWKRKT